MSGVEKDSWQLRKGRGVAIEGKRGSPPLHIGLAVALTGICELQLMYQKRLHGQAVSAPSFQSQYPSFKSGQHFIAENLS